MAFFSTAPGEPKCSDTQQKPKSLENITMKVKIKHAQEEQETT